MPHLPMRSLTGLAIALTLALSACTGAPGTKTPKKGDPPKPPTVVTPVGGGLIGDGGLGLIGHNGGSLIGKVKIPTGIISQNGGNLISDAGAGLVSDKGLGLISDAGAGIVSNNGSGLISKTKYALLAEDLETLPMAKVKVVIVGADGLAIKDADGQPYVAVTDLAGSYHFAHTPTGRNFVVRVLLPGPVGDMRAFLPKDAGAGEKTVDVDFASSLVVGYVLDAFVKGDASVLERLPGAEEALARKDAREAAGETLPASNFTAESLSAAMGTLRAKSPALDAQMTRVKALLLLGQKDLGNGEAATATTLTIPVGVSFDPAGRFAIAERVNNRIRLVETDGRISTLAGTGDPRYTGDGGPAAKATLFLPEAVLFSPDGKALYVADSDNRAVRRIDMATPDHPITTVAGGPAAKAVLQRPIGLGWDTDGKSLLVADSDGHRIWRLTTDGSVLPVLGPGVTGDAGGRTAASAPLVAPTGVAAGPDGTLWALDSETGTVYALAADGTVTPRVFADLIGARGLTVGTDGALYTADRVHECVTRIAPDGTLSTVIGQRAKAAGANTDGPADAITLAKPEGVAVDPQGRLVVCDTQHGLVRRLENGNITSIAGLVSSEQVGTGGSELALARPSFALVAPDGSLLIADTGNAVVRRRAPDGTLSSFAGTGAKRTSGDGGPATEASFAGVGGIAYGPDGSLYVCDLGGFIRRVTPDGLISTIAKGLVQPGAIAVGPDGTLYVAQPEIRNTIVSISPQGVVSPLAGREGDDVSSGDGGPASRAALGLPGGMAIDADGTLWFCEIKGQRIRKLSLNDPQHVISTAMISALAAPTSGNPTDAPHVSFGAPANLIFDKAGRLLIADVLGSQVVRVAPDGTGLTVLVGVDGRAFAGEGVDDGLKQPVGMAFDAAGTLFVVDSANNQVKSVEAGLLGD